MKKVSKDSPLPMYFQIKEIIREMIENEELKPGDLLPPERELCEFHDVSRMTVNKAILSLVNEGLIYREQGKGTFVSNPKKNQELPELKGFTEAMGKNGNKIESRVLSFKLRNSTKRTSKALNIQEGSEVIEITRLRIFNGEPIALETSWLPHDMFPSLCEASIKDSSLYELFRSEFNLKLNSASETIEPIALNDYEAEHLHQDNGALALLFHRVTYEETGIAVEFSKSIFRSDKYKYEIKLS